MSSSLIYRYEKRGRRWGVALTALAVWAGLWVLWWALDMAVWITLLLAVFTLPAVWDVIRDTECRVEIWPNRVVWASPLGMGDRSDIDHVRFNRRFDGGMRVTLVFVGGATTRLPPVIGAPITALEDALQQAGIATQRHPFSPF